MQQKPKSGKYAFPATVCGALLLVFSLWIGYEFIKTYSMKYDARKKLSTHVIAIVTAAMKTDNMLHNPDRYPLESVFRHLAFSGFIKHIRLDQNGQTTAAFNQKKKYILKFNNDGFTVMGDIIVAKKEIKLLSSGKTIIGTLVVAFDSAGIFPELNARFNLLKIFFIIGASSIGMLFIIWSSAIRNRELKKRLAFERGKSEHVDELSLAAAGLAHETKNPLGIIRGLAQNIANNEKNDKKTRNMAKDIMEETDVTTARLGDFLSYAKFRSPEFTDIDAEEFIRKITSLIKDDFDNAGVSLELSIDTAVISADKDMLSQILMNLLTNSLKFTKKGGKVTISVQKRRNNTVELKVADNGTGIPEDILPNIFKPYVTSSASGYGIGLAIVNRITDQAKWNIKLESKEGKGTTITISNIKRSVS